MPRPLATNTGKRTNRDIRNTCWLKRECEAMEVSMEDTHTLVTCTKAVKNQQWGTLIQRVKLQESDEDG